MFNLAGKEQKELIDECIKNNPVAQRRLYDVFSGKMMALSLRYTKNRMEAEEVLQMGFIKVFKHLSSYSHNGSFEGWIKRIIINTAIRFANSKKHTYSLDDVNYGQISSNQESSIDSISYKELIKLIQSLPPGYQMVFNLYVIEGYTHAEIAEIMGISINTSKSQLARAKKVLQQKVLSLEKVA